MAEIFANGVNIRFLGRLLTTKYDLAKNETPKRQVWFAGRVVSHVDCENLPSHS